MQQQTFPPIELLRLGIWGEIKTAKSTLALSFPKPMVHFDLDLSVVRAIHRYNGLTIEQAPMFVPFASFTEPYRLGTKPWPDIMVIPYQVPVRWPGTKIIGMMEMFDAFTNDVFSAYMMPEIKSVSVDTGTMVWKIATAAHLQRVQEKNPGRQSLIQIEYSRPNTELRGLYGGATTYGKNLCITHHVGGIYTDILTNQGVQQQRTGDTWDGFSGMGSLVDVVGRTFINRDTTWGTITPMLRVDTCGYTLALESMEITQPSYESILNKVNELRAAGQ